MQSDKTFKSDLLPIHHKILRTQDVDEKSPGSILTDFETLLKFISPDGIPVSGRLNLLPLKMLPDINAQMAHPLDIDLKRPQQKSYPHINGLFLLLRMTGLTILKCAGKKQILVRDNTIYDSWQSLNFTERYFTLLETWLIKGVPEVIGEPRGIYFHPFIEWTDFFKRIKKNGLKIKGNKDLGGMISFSPGLYTIGLMELFGLISIQHSKPEKGKGWCIERVHRTLFGEALWALLSDYFKTEDYFGMYQNGNSVDFGLLQKIIKPFFPEWRNNLISPKTAFQEGTYILKVSMAGTWRRIAIPGSMFFDDLSTIILKAFDFDSEHLYLFSYKNRYGLRKSINHPYMEDSPPWTDEIRIGDLMLEPDTRMTFLYDLGDKWEFDVKIERIDPVDADIKTPIILETHGTPPEQYPNWEE